MSAYPRFATVDHVERWQDHRDPQYVNPRGEDDPLPHHLTHLVVGMLVLE